MRSISLSIQCDPMVWLTVVLNRLVNLILKVVDLVRQLLVFLLVLANLGDVLLDPVFL